MNIPFPYLPTSTGEGDRENYSSLKIKPELHHTFVWGEPPGACGGGIASHRGVREISVKID